MLYWINCLRETVTNGNKEQGWLIESGFASEKIPMGECEIIRDFSDEKDIIEETIAGFLVSEFKENPPYDNPKYLINHCGLVYPYTGHNNRGYPSYERVIVGEVSDGKIVFYPTPIQMEDGYVAY